MGAALEQAVPDDEGAWRALRWPAQSQSTPSDRLTGLLSTPHFRSCIPTNLNRQNACEKAIIIDLRFVEGPLVI